MYKSNKHSTGHSLLYIKQTASCLCVHCSHFFVYTNAFIVHLRYRNIIAIVYMKNCARFFYLRNLFIIFPFGKGIATSQIASQAFTWGTIAVLPFYTLMVLAPNSKLVSFRSSFSTNYFSTPLTGNWLLFFIIKWTFSQTRRTMESNAPYVLLGVLYAYLLYLSWTPETLKCMFASKYWLPEVGNIE